MKRLLFLVALGVIVGSALGYPETDPADWAGSGNTRKTSVLQYGYPYIDESLTVADSVWSTFYPYMVLRGGQAQSDTVRFTAIYAAIACEVGEIQIELISDALVDSTTVDNATPSGRGDGNRVTLIAPGSAGYQTWIYETKITGFRVRGINGNETNKFHWTVK